MTVLLLFTLNITLPGAVHQGDRVFYSNARSLALGGITSVLEHGDNPATSGVVEKFSLSTSCIFFSANEKRGLRVYDSYGNNMGISTLSNNTFADIGFGASSIVIPFKSLRVGFQYFPTWDFNYSYRREHRDDFSQITKIIEDTYSGNIYTLSPTFCVFYKFISIGVQEQFLTGYRWQEDRVIFPQAPDSIIQNEIRFSGTTTKFGVFIVPNIHFRVAYSYTLKYTITTNEESNDFTYPESHVFGFMYQPPGRIPTKLLGEVAYERWNEPIMIYKFGVEHTILNRYAMRYGFCFFPDYEQTAVWTTVLTFGIGIKTERYYFDFGFGYSKRDYLNSDFGGLDVGEENLKFDESTSHFLLSTGITF